MRVVPERLIGVFDVPHERYCDIVIQCRLKPRSRRDPKPREADVKECGFFSVNDLPRPVQPYTVARISDGVRGRSHPLPVELGPGDWLGES